MAGVSLVDLLPRGGDDLAVHCGGVDHSWSALRDRSDAIACTLADAGVGPGAVVGVLLPDGADLVAALFAVWRAGGVYVPLNPRLTATELDRVLASIDPAVVVTTAAAESRFAGRTLVSLAGPRVLTRPGLSGTGRRDPSVAILSFTSGTTGAPVAVPLTHERVLALLDKVIGTLRTGPSSSSGRAPMPNLIPVPLSVWAGIYQVLFAFRVGAPVVLMDGFETGRFAALVRRFAIRSTVLPPAAMVMLADDPGIDDLAPLRYVRSIASPLSPLQARRFRDRFGIRVLNGYGQTELGGEVVGWSAADARELGDAKLGSVGRPHAGVEVRTDDMGELWVRTPGVVQGVDLGDRLSPDGWFRTGDIATIDGDGFLWIEGRVSDMINRGGLKVHPAEVEEVLRLAPGVADAAVAGVPDDRLGEVPWAWCVPTDPAGLPPAADLEALCREHLAPYKIPVHFAAVPDLPRNEAGKVLKRELISLHPPASKE
ncbi:MAG TPA: class I adenylate-forming enzyme family protein [Acidimicrobiales bacterium]